MAELQIQYVRIEMVRLLRKHLESIKFDHRRWTDQELLQMVSDTFTRVYQAPNRAEQIGQIELQMELERNG